MIYSFLAYRALLSIGTNSGSRLYMSAMPSAPLFHSIAREKGDQLHAVESSLFLLRAIGFNDTIQFICHSHFEGIVPTYSGFNLFILIIFLFFGFIILTFLAVVWIGAGIGHKSAVMVMRR